MRAAALNLIRRLATRSALSHLSLAQHKELGVERKTETFVLGQRFKGVLEDGSDGGSEGGSEGSRAQAKETKLF